MMSPSDAWRELRRRPLPRTLVNKGYSSQSAEVAYIWPWFYAARYKAKRVEAEKPVSYVGTFWGEWSQWRNRLPHEEQEVACCETHLVRPSGGHRTPEAA
jgi:hypothetical protein